MQNNVRQELYDLYKYALEDASSMWLSEYCCSAKERKNREKADEEDLKHFEELLQKLREPGQ